MILRDPLMKRAIISNMAVSGIIKNNITNGVLCSAKQVGAVAVRQGNKEKKGLLQVHFRICDSPFIVGQNSMPSPVGEGGPRSGG